MNATSQSNVGRLATRGLSLAARMTLSYLTARAARTGAAPSEARPQGPQRPPPQEPAPARPATAGHPADPAVSAAIRASQQAAMSSWASRVYNPW